MTLFFSTCDAPPPHVSTAPRDDAAAVIQMQTPSPTPSPPVEDSDTDGAPDDFLYTDSDALSYNGYEVAILRRLVKFRDAPPASNPYAVLRKSGRVVLKFERLKTPLENATRFGLFSFLGGEPKQLIVEQTLPREWAHWIVDLSSKPRIIFDSADYGVGRELMPVDIDRDGVHEITKSIETFDYFDVLAHSESPLLPVVFKYDAPARKYLPANHIFRDYALRGFETARQKVLTLNQTGGGLNGEQQREYLRAMLEAVLPLIYARREGEAWEFYEREYRLPDKAEMQRKIAARLGEDELYKFIRRMK